MNGTPFKLATLAKSGGRPFPAIVLGDDAMELASAQVAARKGTLSTTDRDRKSVV